MSSRSRDWSFELLDAIWTSAAIDCCLRNGIDHFFLAPGSRCTPLTLAVAERGEAHVLQHFDERGLAFAALGYARATGRPGVFVCTSGTAVANAFPAVIEASMEGIPLLLFTADRPDELRGTGANQTIDQRNLFGHYPRAFINLPVPDDLPVRNEEPEQQRIDYLNERLADAIQKSAHGPVHVNWRFREPFSIEASAFRSDSSNAGERSVDQATLATAAESSNATGSDNDDGDDASSDAPNDPLPTFELRGNTVIALGSCRPAEAASAQRLAKRLRCPLLTDVTSGIGGASFELPTQFDLPRPDTVLHVGGRIVSKTWFQWIGSLKRQSVRMLHLTSSGKTINPAAVDVEKTWTELTNLDERLTGTETASDFCRAWEQADQARSAAIQRVLSSTPQLNEPAIAHAISQCCPADTGLFLGNSTPIRDMDWFGCGPRDSIRQVAANRGASGIDGLLATATGYAAGLRKPTTIVLGDLSALHDLNSLSLVANSRWPIIVLIINNQAGHIFDLLPIHQSEHFEQYFATPHRYHFGDAANMFGIPYKRVTEHQTLLDAYRTALAENRSIVLEAMTKRQSNLEVRRKIADEIHECRDRCI